MTDSLQPLPARRDGRNWHQPDCPGVQRCPLVGVDRKGPATAKVTRFDPKQKWRPLHAILTIGRP